MMLNMKDTYKLIHFHYFTHINIWIVSEVCVSMKLKEVIMKKKLTDTNVNKPLA